MTLEESHFCPDCCEPRTYDEIDDCFNCGSLCLSCITDALCDYCIENATKDPNDESSCLCDDGFRLDEVNQNCCEDTCLTCEVHFTCDHCIYGYEPMLIGDGPANHCT
jgi:hypothetical protein